MEKIFSFPFHSQLLAERNKNEQVENNRSALCWDFTHF